MASHTATGEWQSFEIRMRRRRAERLLVRAEVALEEGFLEDARAALDEARRLSSGVPGIAELDARIAAAAAQTAPRPFVRRHARALSIAGSAVLISGAVALRVPNTTQPHALTTAPPLAARASHEAVVAAPILAPVSTPDPSVTIQTREQPPVLLARGVNEPAPAKPATPITPAEHPAAAPPVGSDARVDVPASRASPVAPAGVTPEPLTPTPLPPVAAAVAPTNTAPLTADASPISDLPSTPTHESVVRPLDPSEQDLVRAALHRYADAYSRLDASAAQAVWPGVNRDALARAFGDLAAQSIALGNCSIDVRASVARASCAGTATWQPRVGGAAPRTDARRWSFELNKGPAGWLIRDARVQNR